MRAAASAPLFLKAQVQLIMDFGNLEARRKIQDLVSPTGEATALIYEFYPKFCDIPERDPVKMKERIRQIMDDQTRTARAPVWASPELEDRFQMYYYCDAVIALRNPVMHNEEWDVILKFYASFVSQVMTLYKHMTLPGLDLLVEVMEIINRLIQPEDLSVTGETYSVEECRAKFGANLNGHQIAITRKGKQTVLIRTFVRWNGNEIVVANEGRLNGIKKSTIAKIRVL